MVVVVSVIVVVGTLIRSLPVILVIVVVPWLLVGVMRVA
jgi:hypothetical protein